jgi:hypothetical protein
MEVDPAVGDTLTSSPFNVTDRQRGLRTASILPKPCRMHGCNI